MSWFMLWVTESVTTFPRLALRLCQNSLRPLLRRTVLAHDVGRHSDLDITSDAYVPVHNVLEMKRALSWLALWVTESVTTILMLCVRLYQIFLSPMMGQWCRFTPTCSQYYIRAVGKYGPIWGSIKGALRICRCHPFHPGGHDPP